MKTAIICPIKPPSTTLPEKMSLSIYLISAIADWQPKRDVYHLSEIAFRLNVPMTTQLAFALRVNNWKQEKFRLTEGNRRLMQTLWLPPTARAFYKRAQGRPSHQTYLIESLTKKHSF